VCAQTTARTYRSVAKSAVHSDGVVRCQCVSDRSNTGHRRDSVRHAGLQPRPRPPVLPPCHVTAVARQQRQLVPETHGVARRWFLTAVTVNSSPAALRHGYFSVFSFALYTQGRLHQPQTTEAPTIDNRIIIGTNHILIFK